MREAIDPSFAGQQRVAIFGYISGAGPKLFFKGFVPLQYPGPEAYVPSTKTYQLKLTAGKSETISIPVAQSIPPKSSDRFELRTVSDKSASFSMTFEIYDTGKHVVGTDAMTIDLFRSRLDNELAHDSKEKNTQGKSDCLLSASKQISSISPRSSKYNWKGYGPEGVGTLRILLLSRRLAQSSD